MVRHSFSSLFHIVSPKFNSSYQGAILSSLGVALDAIVQAIWTIITTLASLAATVSVFTSFGDVRPRIRPLCVRF